MDLLQEHIAILLQEGQRHHEQATKVTNGEIFDLVRDCITFDEFRQKFLELLKTK